MIEKKIWLPRACLAILVLAQITVCICFGIAKGGYDIDEMLTYGLANGHNKPFLTSTPEQEDTLFLYREQVAERFAEQEGTAITGDSLRTYFTAQKDQLFDFGSAYRNQINDSHPPLYYILFNALSSLTPNLFSKWTGLSLNIAFGAGSMLLLYALGKKLLGGSYLALLPAAFWGFSAGCISYTMFLRMYSMFSFFALLLCYYLSLLLSNKERKWGIYLGLGIAMLLGALTHHYFIIFAFFLSAFSVLYLLLRRRFADAGISSGVMLAGVGLSIAIFPATLSHIFSGYRGEQAFSSFESGFSGLWEKLSAYCNILSDELFGGYLRYLFIAFLIFAALSFLCIFLAKRLKRQDTPPQYGCVSKNLSGIFLAAILCYFLLVAQISPFFSGRYICCLYPLIALCGTAFIYWVLSPLIRSKALRCTAIALVFCILSISSYATQKVLYIYPEVDKSVSAQLSSYQEMPTAFVISAPIRITGSLSLSAPYLMQRDEFYPFQLPRIESGETDLDAIFAEEQQVLLMISTYHEARSPEEVAQSILEHTSFSSLQPLFSREQMGMHTSTFLLQR